MMDHGTQCDCPICPLVKNNVQVCDVLVRENDTKQEYKVYHTSGLAEEDADNLYGLVVGMTYKDPIKIGSSRTMKGDDYCATVERIAKNKYRVCFHAENK